MKIVHIVNPVILPPDHGSYLYYAQPVTFASMRRAQQEARKHDIEVVLAAACYPEDAAIVPAYMHMTPHLSGSVIDIIPTSTKKLPFLQDIIDRLVAIDGDVYIYTNVDIGVQPHFYTGVLNLLEGLDSLMINRRQLPEFFEGRRLGVDDLPQIYKLRGKRHPGSDTFAWRKHLAHDIDTKKGIVGMPPIAGILEKQLWKHSGKHHLFKNEFLTFHLGFNKWDLAMMKRNADLVNFNWTQAPPEARRNPLTRRAENRKS